MTTPAAGWYADPGGSGGRRYWTGAAWTDQISSVPGQSGPTAGSGNSEWPPLSPPNPAVGSGPRPDGSATDYGQAESPAQDFPATQSQPAESGHAASPESSETTWGRIPAPGVDYQAQADPGMKFGPDGQALAGWWRRFAGYLIDAIVLGFVTTLAVGIIGALSGAFSDVINMTAFEELLDKMEPNAAGEQTYQPTPEEVSAVLGPGFMTLVVTGWLVYLILSMLNGVVLVARSGQTVGDRVVQTRKVVAGRRPPTLGAALLRWLIPTTLLMASNIPFLGFAGYAAWLVDHLRPLWDNKRQTWHDKAASTYVERADVAGPLAK